MTAGTRGTTRAAARAALPPTPADPARALAPYDGPWTADRAAHLLRRALGGASREETAACAARSPAEALDALFAPPDTRLEAEQRALGRRLARTADREALAGWWLGKLVRDGRATGSRLALLLHDHFACAQSKTRDLPALFDQHQLFVEHGGGPFGELLRRVVRGPAMLRFLDGDSNRRSAPNENLAREVLELFTLGVGRFSETDVKEAARALTGWTIRDGAFAHVAEHHDPRPKRVLGETIDDGDDLCRVAVAQPRCARFLAGKFWRAYVSPAPADDVLDLLAERWRAHDLEVAWLLRTLLGSRAFHAAEARRSLVRSPAELVVATLRGLGTHPDLVATARACDAMGQRLFEPPGVQGWAGGEAWIHAAAWIARTDFAARQAGALDDAALARLFAPTGSLVARLFGGDAPDDAARALALLGLDDLPPERAAALDTALPAHVIGDDRRRDLLHAALCLPEAHLS